MKPVKMIERDGSTTDIGPARPCLLCGAVAVVRLTPTQRAEQPDGTTWVCHPALGGCNWGFEEVVQ